MSESKRRLKLSEDEIRAVYRQGEDAVVSLVTQLLERLNAVESRLEALEKRPKRPVAIATSRSQAMVHVCSVAFEDTCHPCVNRTNPFWTL